jgi:lipopolysaccharide export system protein LptA
MRYLKKSQTKGPKAVFQSSQSRNALLGHAVLLESLLPKKMKGFDQLRAKMMIYHSKKAHCRSREKHKTKATILFHVDDHYNEYSNALSFQSIGSRVN